jgi:hypothetical protein
MPLTSRTDWPQALDTHPRPLPQPLLRCLDVLLYAWKQHRSLKHQPLELLYAVPEQQRARCWRGAECSGMLGAYCAAWRFAADNC